MMSDSSSNVSSNGSEMTQFVTMSDLDNQLSRQHTPEKNLFKLRNNLSSAMQSCYDLHTELATLQENGESNGELGFELAYVRAQSTSNLVYLAALQYIQMRSQTASGTKTQI